MAAYVIANVEVLDPETYLGYSQQVPQTVRQYGGEFLVRGGTVEEIEGSFGLHRVVVLRFDSVARAHAWYDSPEYQAILPTRLRATNSRVVIVEGT
jgi:uncharacterized protein (DUF1330 family)